LGGYDEKITVGEDWELYVRLSRQFEVECIAEPVLKIRQHSGPRLGDRVDAALRTERHTYVAFGQSMSKELKAKYLRKMGGKYVRVGAPSRGRRYLCHAIRLDPFCLMGYWQIVSSFLGTRAYKKIHATYKQMVAKRPRCR
jgi:hypothetical protein